MLGPGEKIPMKWRRNINEKIIFVARLRRHVSSKQSALIRMFKSNKNWVISAVDHSRMAEGLSRIWEQHVNSAPRPWPNVGGKINRFHEFVHKFQLLFKSQILLNYSNKNLKNRRCTRCSAQNRVITALQLLRICKLWERLGFCQTWPTSVTNVADLLLIAFA